MWFPVCGSTTASRAAGKGADGRGQGGKHHEGGGPED